MPLVCRGRSSAPRINFRGNAAGLTEQTKNLCYIVTDVVRMKGVLLTCCGEIKRHEFKGRNSGGGHAPCGGLSPGTHVSA